MTEKIRRPVLIWITQVLLCLDTLILLTLDIFLVRELWAGHKIRPNGIPIGLALFVMVVVSLLAFWDLLNRRKSGKWLAAAALMVSWIIFVVMFLTTPEYSGPTINNLTITHRVTFEEKLYTLVTFSWLHFIGLAPAVGLLISKNVDRFLDRVAGK